ncbi:MAG: pyridoxal-phosphate dependent enzyme [Cyanobacteria bacterium P01_F01_bin.116]
MANLSPQAIEQAAKCIDPVFLNTPQFELDVLNNWLGIELVLKVETLNPIRCFKGRGTDYFVQQYAHASSFVCASAGNFGQGMAYACRKWAIPLTVFAAATANPLKLERMRELGAEIHLAGEDFDASKEAAKAYAAEKNHPFIEDGREVAISIGAGTIGLELSQYSTTIDTLLVPVGNGALINGIAAWYKAHQPSTQVIGVVAQGAPTMALSWQQGQPIPTATVNTIADGIAVRTPVPEALKTMTTLVDDVVQVTDNAILEAMRLLHRLAGVVVEPAGAVGVAAATVYKNRFAGHQVATTLCGSNLTKAQIAQWL